MADTIFLCTHCGEKMNSNRRHCKDCSTAKQRKENTEENNKIQLNLKKKYQ